MARTRSDQTKPDWTRLDQIGLNIYIHKNLAQNALAWAKKLLILAKFSQIIDKSDYFFTKNAIFMSFSIIFTLF